MVKNLEYFSLPVDSSIQPFEDDRFFKIRLKFIHEDKNPNGSFFSLDVIKSAESSITDIPILASIIKDDKDFGEHDIGIEDTYDDDGNLNQKMIYIERPIGVIPSVGNNYHYETIDGVTYAFVDGYIWKEYAQDEVDIFERDKVKKMSMEIKIEDSKYEPRDKTLYINKYKYLGLTLLGDKFGTGMKDARASKINFSENKEFTNMLKTLKKVMKYSNSNTKVIKIKNDALLAEKYYTKKRTDVNMLKIQLCNCLNNDEVIKEAFVDSENLQYLHHKLVNNQLIVDKDELELCAKRLLETSDNSDFINHLYNHYIQLNINTSLFTDAEETKKHYKELELEMGKFAKDPVDEIIANAQKAEIQKKAIALQEQLSLKMTEKFATVEESEDEEAKNKFSTLKDNFNHFVEMVNKFADFEKFEEFAEFADIEQTFSDFENMAKNFEDYESSEDYCNSKYEEFKAKVLKAVEDKEEDIEKKEEDIEKKEEDVEKEEEKEETKDEKFVDVQSKYEELQISYDNLKKEFDDMKEKYEQLKAEKNAIEKEEKVKETKKEFAQFSSIISEEDFNNYVIKAVEGNKEEVLKELKATAFDLGQVNGNFTSTTFGLQNNIPADTSINKKTLWDKISEEVK